MLSIRIDNGMLLATRVRVISGFWQRHRPFDRPHLSSEQGLLLNPGGNVHTFGMPCAVDIVFLDPTWRVLRIVPGLQPRHGAIAPAMTRLTLLLAEGRCELAGLAPGRILMQDAAATRTAQSFATTVLRRADAATPLQQATTPQELGSTTAAADVAGDLPPNRSSAMRSRGGIC